MRKKLLNQAWKMACEHLPSHPHYDDFTFFHYTAVVHNGEIIKLGNNKAGIPPDFLGYRSRLQFGKYPTMHSELVAVSSCRNDIKGNFGIINIRLNRLSVMRNSFPCKCCMGYLKMMGCSECYFSTDNGFAKFLI
jgi:hypothetical protein